MADLIISADYIKQYSPVDYSIDEGYVTPLIEDSQEFIVQELLGSTMYDDLLSEINAESVSANYVAIKTYLENIVMNDTLYRLCLENTFKLTNQGAVTKSGDNNTALTEREITRISSRYRSKADHWRYKLWRYLNENSTDYPLWTSPASDCLIYPKRPRFRTSMT